MIAEWEQCEIGMLEISCKPFVWPRPEKVNVLRRRRGNPRRFRTDQGDAEFRATPSKSGHRFVVEPLVERTRVDQEGPPHGLKFGRLGLKRPEVFELHPVLYQSGALSRSHGPKAIQHELRSTDKTVGCLSDRKFRCVSRGPAHGAKMIG